MEMAATISNRLFALSVELRMKDSSSIPTRALLLPVLLASLLQAMMIRPLIVVIRHWFGLLVLKLEETCPFVIRLSPSPVNPRWLQVLNKVTSDVIRILMSEQTSLLVVYVLAPHLFDIKFKLKVEVGMLRVMLLLLRKNMARLLLRLAIGLARLGHVRVHGRPRPGQP